MPAAPIFFLQVDHAAHRAETKLQKEGARAQLKAAEAKDFAEAKGVYSRIYC